MSLHLIKLCVGADSIDDLRRSTQSGEPMAHVTRMFPKRGDALLDGGSLYWVIKRMVQVRQRIIGLEEVRGQDGIRRCAIMLDPELVRTAPAPRRPFQGWRYLKADEAPQDLGPDGAGGEDLPDNLRAKLLELGAW